MFTNLYHLHAFGTQRWALGADVGVIGRLGSDLGAVQGILGSTWVAWGTMLHLWAPTWGHAGPVAPDLNAMQGFLGPTRGYEDS